jgi:hypothetical protein
MGRTYLFECSKCGYRARVSGGADRGFHFAVQTILCRECEELYDAVTELKIPDARPALLAAGLAPFRREGPTGARKKNMRPPAFASALNRLPPPGARQFRWLNFEAACPVSLRHRVEKWTQPGKCPKCGYFLEPNAIPFRIWD